MTEHTSERCGCGATFEWSGSSIPSGSLAAARWRTEHRCTHPPAPGPCWRDSGVTWPGESASVRCDLLAGHEGAHQADRGSRGGTAVWLSGEEQR